MDLTKRYQADKKKATDGVKIPVGDAFFTLAYTGSAKAKLLLHGKTQQHASVMKNEDAVIQAMQDVLVNDVVLGWANLKEDGKAIKYSKKTLIRLLKTYVGLDLELMEKASEIEHYQREKQEEIEGN